MSIQLLFTFSLLPFVLSPFFPYFFFFSLNDSLYIWCFLLRFKRECTCTINACIWIEKKSLTPGTYETDICRINVGALLYFSCTGLYQMKKKNSLNLYTNNIIHFNRILIFQLIMEISVWNFNTLRNQSLYLVKDKLLRTVKFSLCAYLSAFDAPIYSWSSIVYTLRRWEYLQFK